MPVGDGDRHRRRRLIGDRDDRDRGRPASGPARRSTRSWSPRRRRIAPSSAGDYYVIRPMLPELDASTGEAAGALDRRVQLGRRGAVRRKPRAQLLGAARLMLEDVDDRGRRSCCVEGDDDPRHAPRDHPAVAVIPLLDEHVRPRAGAHRPELRPDAERHVLRGARACATRRVPGRRGETVRRAGRASCWPRSSPCSREQRPDRLLILGDTNSGLVAIVASRLGIPVFHMEAGNRCYDDRVPEEVNRRDHRPQQLGAAALHRTGARRTCCARGSSATGSSSPAIRSTR